MSLWRWAPATTVLTVSPPPATFPVPAPNTQKSPLLFPVITCAIALVAGARIITKK
jgi:hypothetical protein